MNLKSTSFENYSGIFRLLNWQNRQLYQRENAHFSVSMTDENY